MTSDAELRRHRLKNLSPEKRRLIARRLLKNKKPATPASQIPEREPGVSPPPSHAQLGLWLIQQASPNNTAYNIQEAIRLSGPLDLLALDFAITRITERHEILRTRYLPQGEECAQIIDPPRPQSVPILDFQNLKKTTRQHAVQGVISADSNLAFDLAHEAATRILVLRMNAVEHVLVLSMHHISSDGASGPIFFEELKHYYASHINGLNETRPPLPIQYGDFSTWQRQALASHSFSNSENYWRQQLQDSTTSVWLPLDRQRPKRQTFTGKRMTFAIPKVVNEGLAKVAQSCGATLYHVLFSAVAYLMHRYSGQRDFNIGTPTTYRHRLELINVIGLLLNTLVIRVRVPQASSFEQLVAAVRETLLAAQLHQDFPIEEVIRILNLPRNLSYSPLFNVMFIFHELKGKPIALDGLVVTPQALENDTAKFDLTFTMRLFHEGLSCEIEYNTELFEAATIRAMEQCLQTLLRSITAAPTRTGLELADSATQQQWLLQGPTRPIPARTVPSWVTQVAATRHKATVVLYNDSHQSYSDLMAFSWQVANGLGQRGVRPGDRIGVCLHRQLKLPAVLLGIMRVGAAYVPLDPTQPKHRRELILHEARPKVIVTDQATVDAFQTRDTLCLDRDQIWLEQQATTGHKPAILPELPSYIMFTSGSTGRPKGVVVSQRNVVNFLEDLQQQKIMGPADKMVAVTTIAFDISVNELFLPLICGAQVVIADDQTTKDGTRLMGLIASHRATLMQATPATWRMLLDAGWSKPMHRFNALCGGDTLSQDLANDLRERCDGLINLYGPTETTIWSTRARIDRGEAITLGRPSANQTVAILDSYGDPVPPGVQGELHIGGDGVTYGYWQRPALTAAQFAPDPFAKSPGQRRYATGDRAKIDRHGRLTFHGRFDHQIKLRGFRIELGDIEQTLSAHRSVRHTAVLLVNGGAGPILTAFVVMHADLPVDIAQLQAFMSERLPAYMIPTAWKVLDALPINDNGKLNRKALSITFTENLNISQHAVEAPVGDVEIELAKIWSEVLHWDKIGRHTHFFHDLGGHSLTANRVITRIRETFKVDLSTHDFFETPTIAAIAKRVSKGDPKADTAIAVQPRPEKIPLAYSQQRLWFLHQVQGQAAVYNINTTIEVTGRLSTAALATAISDIVDRHESLRTGFSDSDGKPYQHILPSGIFRLTLIDLSTWSADPAQQQAMLHAKQFATEPFDLQKPPLYRMLCQRLHDKHHFLTLSMHHLIADAWSLNIFVSELTTLYRKHLLNTASTLSPLPVQYADYAIWQRKAFGEEACLRMQQFWQKELADAPPSIHIPSDRPDPAVPDYSGDAISFPLDRKVLSALQTIAMDQNATAFMIHLAIFAIFLHELSGQDDLAIGTAFANRNRRETEPLIGFLVNSLIIRLQIENHLTFTDLVATTRQRTLDAFAHGELPFEKIVAAVNPDRRQASPPFHRVRFLYQHTAAEETLNLAGARFKTRELEQAKMRYALQLAITSDVDHAQATLSYQTALFDRETMQAYANRLQRLLAELGKQPQAPLTQITRVLTKTDQQQQLEAVDQLQSKRRSKLGKFKRRKIRRHRDQLVRSYAHPSGLPWVFEPNAEDIDLLDWSSHHQDEIHQRLAKTGAILFRNFAVGGVAGFGNFVKRIVSADLLDYTNRSTPRTQVGDKIFTSTEYPADQWIPLHNENAYDSQWAMKILFYCDHAAAEGGATPIADSRAVYKRLDPQLVRRFTDKGVLYVRNYGKLDLPWQDVFQTDDKLAVANYCQRRGIEFSWIDDHHLRTRQRCQATARHPQTGDMVWFNQAHLFHVSNLDEVSRQSLLEAMPEADLPRNAYFGDGEPIPTAMLDEIRAAYDAERKAFPWQQGDLLLLDNMLTAHGRAPYKGERRILVALTDPYQAAERIYASTHQ